MHEHEILCSCSKSLIILRLFLHVYLFIFVLLRGVQLWISIIVIFLSQKVARVSNFQQNVELDQKSYVYVNLQDRQTKNSALFASPFYFQQ